MNEFLHMVLKRCLLGALMIALLTLPFVHRTGAAPVSKEMSQFISMGGDLADICGEGSTHRASGCESCNITAAMLLPLHAPLRHPVFNLTPLHRVMADRTMQHLPAPHTTPPVRAPPRA